MSELKPIIGFTKKTYPLDSELWVEFYTDVVMGVVTEIEPSAGNVEGGLLLAKSVVKDWNFADIDGSKLSVDIEGIKKLPSKLAMWIIEEAASIIKPDKEKKKG